MKPEIVTESATLSELYQIPKIRKSSTAEFPKDKATIRLHRTNRGHDASICLYYKGNDVRVNFWRYDQTEPDNVHLAGAVKVDEFDTLVDTIKDVMAKRKALAP